MKRGVARLSTDRVWATLPRMSSTAGTGASILVDEGDEQIAELMRDFLDVLST